MGWCGLFSLAWAKYALQTSPSSGASDFKHSPSFALRQNAFLKVFWATYLIPRLGFSIFLFASVYSRRSRCIFMDYGSGDVACFDRYHLVNAVDLGNATYFSLLKQPKFVRGLDRVTGSIFLIFALKLVLSKR